LEAFDYEAFKKNGFEVKELGYVLLEMKINDNPKDQRPHC
jgi:hypothetical protein